MLSAKKIKLHGMKSRRWETKDKIVQYKGLINLFTRDRKIMQFDSTVFGKKQKLVLKQLQKNIGVDRRELDNAIRGDKQQIRNALQDHKRLQLAYQELHALQIIDHISQDNFSKRKELDRHYHTKRLKTELLVQAKLQLAEMEDRVKYEQPGNLPSEVKSKIVTGQVQDAILKKDAAISVRTIYKQILNIMKKDVIYFDALLLTLKQDAKLQGICMHRTIQLGQVATEYLDDRLSEFQKLEKFVKRDMKQREKQLDALKESFSGLSKELRLLIRRDSELNMADGYHGQYRTVSELVVLSDLEYMKTVFRRLEDVTRVTRYEDVFSYMQEQQSQFERLKELSEIGKVNRDILVNKAAHTEYMYYDMLYTMNETTFEYNENKELLRSGIKKEIKRMQKIKENFNAICNLILKIKPALQHLELMCKVIESPTTARPTFEPDVYTEEETRRRQIDSISIQNDGHKIIEILLPKLQALNAKPIHDLTYLERDKAQYYMETLVCDRAPNIDYEPPPMDISLLEGLGLESIDTNVLSRKDIKKLSKEVVLKNTVTDDFMPVFDSRKKK